MVMDTFGSSLKLTNSVLHGRLVFNLGQDGVHLRTNIPGRSAKLQEATSQPAIPPSQFAQLLGALCVYPTVANHHHHLAGRRQKTKAPLQSLAFYSCWSQAVVDAGKFHGKGKNIFQTAKFLQLDANFWMLPNPSDHPTFKVDHTALLVNETIQSFFCLKQTKAGSSLKMYAGLGGLCVVLLAWEWEFVWFVCFTS